MAVFLRSNYFSIPHTGARRKLAVARLLDKHGPPDPGPDLERYAKAMRGEIEALTGAYQTRHIEDSKVTPREDGELDNFVDVLWSVTRDRLDHWQVFTMAAPARFANEADAALDYPELAQRAARVRRVRELLLGGAGVEFTRLKYVEQAEHMRTMWSVIESEGLSETLEHAVGLEFVEALRDGQARYLSMIDRRLAAARGSEVDLRARALALHETMQHYVLALLVALDEEDPASLAQTRHALRPLDALREQLALERSGATIAQPGEAPAESGPAAELIAEEQQLGLELGFEADAENAADPGAEG